MKKIFKNMVGILALSTTLFATPIFANQTLNLDILGENIVTTDVAPYLSDSRTMVPVRLISENLGFNVKWDGGTKEFSVKGVDVVDKEIVLIAGKMNQSQVAVSKGSTVTKKNIDDSPKVVVTMKNDRLYVPLRFFSESFSLIVKYDTATRTVFIQMPNGNQEENKPSADVVWNGDVKDFLNNVVDKTGMELSNSGNQVALDKNDLLVTDGSKSPNGKGFKVELTAMVWDYTNTFLPQSVKETVKEVKSNTKTVLEMYTSDKTVFSKVDNAVKNKKTTTINTSDGKKITINGEGGMIIIRLY